MPKIVKISVLHVVLLSMTVIGLKNHVTLLPPILEEAGRDGWLSVIVGFIYVLPLLACLVYAHQTNDVVIARPVKMVIAVFILLLCAMTMIEMLQWINTTFLPRTPIVALLAGYFLLCVTFATKGIQAIVVVNVIVLAVVIFLGFMVAFINLQVKDYSLLQPFFEHGLVPPLIASVFPASGFLELSLLLLLTPYMKTRLKFWQFLLMTLFLVGLTLGPLIGAITAFGPEEASKQRYPAYEEWGLATIGDFIDHMDFFSIYQWMTGAFIRVSFYLFLVALFFNIEHEPKKIWRYIAPAFALICLVLLILDEEIFLYANNYVVPIATLVILTLFTVYMLVASFMKRKKERKIDGKVDV